MVLAVPRNATLLRSGADGVSSGSGRPTNGGETPSPGSPVPDPVRQAAGGANDHRTAEGFGHRFPAGTDRPTPEASVGRRDGPGSVMGE